MEKKKPFQKKHVSRGASWCVIVALGPACQLVVETSARPPNHRYDPHALVVAHQRVIRHRMAPPMRIAVIGGGVGACSLTFGLREALAANTATLHLFEMGRIAGGRATTRETREKPGLRVDHGVPAFAAHSEPFIRLCEDLVDSDVLQRCDSTKFGRLTADGTFESDDVASAPTRFRASEGKGISALCHALLRGGDPNRDDALARVTMSTMVSGIESTDGGSGWRLTSNKGADLGTFDWLVVTSTALAHPRWRSTFGGEPPLVVAEAAMGDPHLSATLEELAPLTAKPVTACLLAYEDEAAEA